MNKHLNSHAREIVLQAVYQMEIGAKPLEEVKRLNWLNAVPEQEVCDYVCALLEDVYKNSRENIKRMHKYSSKEVSQLSALVSGVLHIGLCELQKDGSKHAIIIDDLVELVRKYDGEESTAFVNGILDSFYHKEICPSK